LAGLERISPAIPWEEFFAGLEAPELTQINVVVRGRERAREGGRDR